MSPCVTANGAVAFCKPIRDGRTEPGSTYTGAPYQVFTCPFELWSLVLHSKLHEEADEIRRAPNDISEYADLIQAALDLAMHNAGFTPEDIETERLRKLKAVGGFTARKVLIRTA